MKRLLPALAALGLIISVGAVIYGNQPPSAVSPPTTFPCAPFPAWVAGSGTLEASTQNIAVGSAVSGIVSEVCVTWGDWVKPGDRLFTVDDRDLQAKLDTAVANVQVAEASLEKAEHALSFVQTIEDTVSKKDVASRRDDVSLAKAGLQLARAQVQEIRTEIERRVGRAPVAGRILQVNVRPGELAGGKDTPLLLLGDDKRLNVRVEVDQHDSWRVRPGAKAVAFVRGNPSIQIPLDFVRVEPFVIPKVSFSGKATERTDVKVLQVIFGFDRADFPVYAGEEVDVFIDAAPLPE
jgi:multidrug efflux pump subunit AcrA (membrane-fusion protein)